jgi:flagellar hook-associated protein 1 FlgK
MSLFGSIQMASNTLRADQIAMQVIGQNISNANTPGYIREETIFSPAPTQRVGNLSLGLGVQVDAIVQKIDRFLEERLRGAISDQSSAETQANTSTQVEQLLGELSSTDISTAMNTFFNSISEVLNQPENVSVRNLAILNAGTVTQEINGLAQDARQLRTYVNDRVRGMADEINVLAEQIRDLNLQIVQCEAGGATKSPAVGLRDQRGVALENLAKLVDIHVKESDSGSTTVSVGGDILVADAVVQPVKVSLSSDRGMTVASIHFAETDSPLQASGGELYGLEVSRDQILGGFLDKLDDFAGTLAFEFNKVFASGQGLSGYDAATSQSLVTAADKPLNEAGLKFAPVNGSFQVLVQNTKDKTTQVVDVQVHLLGDDTDTTLQSLADTLNRLSPLSATVSSDGRLSIASQSATQEFAFANDTSGALAALGINTLFTGSTAMDLGINQEVASDPAKFAASLGGIGVDTENAVKLAGFADQPIVSHNNESITTVYDRLVADTAQTATVTQAAAVGAQAFQQALSGQKMATSGVSIDEEAVNMIGIQKAFQASARYITTLRDMLDTLINI